MSTIYQRYQRYLEKAIGPPFSRTLFKRICRYIRYTYDIKPGNEQPPYIESIEDGVSYSARNYPESFTKTIDHIIRRIGEKLPPPAIKRPKRPRIKVVANRPAYRASSKQN